MKKYSPVFFLVGSILITFFSCKKINESTELGSGLIPSVDNVHTFDTSMLTITSNLRLTDSIRIANTDWVALGDLNDPEFGVTHASFQFGILPSAAPGSYPYYHKDSAKVDSVVLSLDYIASYGDTTPTAQQTLRVFEIAPNSGYKYDSIYRYDDAGSDYPTTGIELGSKSFTLKNVKTDSLDFKRGQDTAKRFGVVRITLPNSFGTRLINYDTSSTANGGYGSDSTFRTLFKGFSIKADASGNVLNYFDVSSANTKLTVYYKVEHANGSKDTLSYDYSQSPLRGGFSTPQGKTNYVKFSPNASPWFQAYNSSTPDSKVYVQGAPSGSFTSIVIPGLDTFPNKVIHRAELIATRITSPGDNTFYQPGRLYLDRFRQHGGGNKDSSILFEKDILVASDGSLNFSSFGGNYKNNSYTFNITRYVQSIVTKDARNDTLRIYAPFETESYLPSLGLIAIPISSVIYNGRVVLAGGDYPNPAMKMRLRIIYSNL